jgi:hypothetical protein
MEGLFNDVAREIPKGWVYIPMIVLVWRRLHRMRARFASILARFRAGTLPAPGAARRPPAADRPADGSDPSPRPLKLPQHSGWLIHSVSWLLTIRRYELEEMLDDPEAAAFVADAPQAGSVLRPMCRMLAVKQPPWLRRPRRRVVKPPPPPPPDWVVNQPGAILHADGTVWQRWGASTLWRPGDPGTLEQAQKFDRPRQIWPRRD